MNEHLERLKDLAISDTGFVFDPYSGATFNTNSSGRTILQALKEGMDRPAVLNRLQESYEVGEDDLERDLDEFVYLLRENGILPGDFRL